MERAGRKDEIIPLCEAEARKTGSFDRLVKRLISAKRYEDVGPWIQEGIRATEKKWPGIAANLRDKLREIRTVEKNWPVVAAMQAEEFVRRPSRQAFQTVRKPAAKPRSGPMFENLYCATSKKVSRPGSRRAGPFRSPAWTGLMRISVIDFPWLTI